MVIQDLRPSILDDLGLEAAVKCEHMVFGRRGRGGPQLAEVARMLASESAAAAADRASLRDESEHLADAEASLDKAFAALAN